MGKDWKQSSGNFDLTGLKLIINSRLDFDLEPPAVASNFDLGSGSCLTLE